MYTSCVPVTRSRKINNLRYRFLESGRRRQATGPGPVVLRTLSQARAWRPAVGAPLERGVRRHRDHFVPTASSGGAPIFSDYCSVIVQLTPVESRISTLAPAGREYVPSKVGAFQFVPSNSFTTKRSFAYTRKKTESPLYEARTR